MSILYENGSVSVTYALLTIQKGQNASAYSIQWGFRKESWLAVKGFKQLYYASQMRLRGYSGTNPDSETLRNSAVYHVVDCTTSQLPHLHNCKSTQM